MKAYEADRDRFEELDAQVLGISVDSAPCHVAFAESLGGLNYDLLSDFHPKGEVAKSFGTWKDDLGFSGRVIYIVDKDGKIVYKNVHELGKQPDNKELFDVLKDL